MLFLIRQTGAVNVEYVARTHHPISLSVATIILSTSSIPLAGQTLARSTARIKDTGPWAW